MEGSKRPSDRVVKVERSFEWSRLESQLMTSAYAYVVPDLRSARVRLSLAEHDLDGNAFDGLDHTRQRQATGA